MRWLCCSIKSPVDEKQMDGVPSVKIHSGTDYISNSHLIRWTEVFILQVREGNTQHGLVYCTLFNPDEIVGNYSGEFVVSTVQNNKEFHHS